MLKHCVTPSGSMRKLSSNSSLVSPQSVSSISTTYSVFDFNMPDAVLGIDRGIQERIYENIDQTRNLPDLLDTSLPRMTRCEPHCLCGGSKTSTPSPTSITSTSTPQSPDLPFPKPSRFWDLFGAIDRRNAITFKRKVAPMPNNPQVCVNCTCYLDPVELTDGQGSRPSSESKPAPVDLTLANNQRNKLNLRISPPNSWTYDPLYDLIANSPVLKKLKEFGFTYPPDKSQEEKDARKRRVLIALIVVLLVAVVVIIVTNIIVAHFLISQKQSNQRNNSASIPLYRISPIDLFRITNQSIGIDRTVGKSISVHRLPSSSQPDQTPKHEVTNLQPHSSNETPTTEIPVKLVTSGNANVDPTPPNVPFTQQPSSKFTTQQFDVTTNYAHQTTPHPNRVTATPKGRLHTPSPQRISNTPLPSVENRPYQSRVPFLTTTSRPAASAPVTSSSRPSTVAKTTPKPVPTWVPSYPVNKKCDNDQFRCRSGVSRLPCLYPWERCDGIQDCSDGSDEEFCDVLECYGNFKCKDQRCVSLAKVCNGIADCADGSDEQNCESFQCKSYEYRCPSGYCIPKQWVCDGEADCPDHREEYNCSNTCSDDKFMCKEGWCITNEWKCNGVPDCAGGEDELNCECAPTDFKCGNGGCVDANHVCDGISHCSDGSDEWKCAKLTPDGTLLVRKGIQLEYAPVCANGWHKNHSDLVCSQLGFKDSRMHGTVQLTEVHHGLYGISKHIAAHPNARIQFLLDKRSRSSCSSAVSIQCSTFTCGVWPSRSKRAIPASTRYANRSPRVKRIVDGQLSDDHQWPSVGILYHHIKKWACTASIIAPGWVLTSALCVRRTDALPFDWKFLAGSAQPSSPDNSIQSRSVMKFIQHPSYKFVTQLANNDVMLVQLDHALTFDMDTVAPICLPHRPTQEGSWCVTAGWGYIMPGGFYVNKVLKHIDLGIWSQEACNSTDHYAGAITNRMLCAGSENVHSGPCFNDEGSPLMCHDPHSQSWYLAGVLTSQNCGSFRAHPSVFADTFALRDWISNSVGFG